MRDAQKSLGFRVQGSGFRRVTLNPLQIRQFVAQKGGSDLGYRIHAPRRCIRRVIEDDERTWEQEEQEEKDEEEVLLTINE